MVNWQTIDTVLLDMDGTLLDLHYDNYFWLHYVPKRYADIHRQDEGESRRHLNARMHSERGTLNWYCVDYWSEQLQLDIPALKREIKHMIRIRPHVLDFLQQLRASSRRIILVTNAHRKALNIKMAHTGMETLFDELVVSHDFRAPKEEHAFWHQLHMVHPFDPETTLLVDDNASVLHSAKQYGIRHLLTLLQPDSKQARRRETEFPGILHFDEIMPIEELPL